MPRSRMSTLMPAWNGTISVTGLLGNSEAWAATAAAEIARLVKPASASGTILRDTMRMRFLLDALRPSDAAVRRGKRSGSPCACT